MCVNQKEDDGDEFEEGGKYYSDFFSTKSNNCVEDLPSDKIPEAETIVDRYNVPIHENILKYSKYNTIPFLSYVCYIEGRQWRLS